MKAIVFYEHGGVDKLQYREDIAHPSLEGDQVLVNVKACALNHLDLWARKGLPGVTIPLPHISGSDISGVVAEVGRSVRNIALGSEVIVSPGLSCGHCLQCLSGFDNACVSYNIVGYQSNGGYAEFVNVPAVNIIPKPKNLSFIEAAAIPLVFLTVWHMLVTRASVKPGEYVLILGAGSGVGSAAIQVAKLLGACVIATVGSESKLEKASALGADYALNHNIQDIVAETRRITNRRGVDVAFEHVGQATWDKSLRALARRGRLVTCGATTGAEATTDLRYVFGKELTLLGSFMGGKAELLKVLEFIENGALKPIVDSVYPLKEAPQAQSRMENREHFGKIVLTI